MFKLASGHKPSETEPQAGMHEAAEIALPFPEPDQRLEPDDQVHRRFDQRLLQDEKQTTKDHGPQRIGVVGVEQRDAGDPVTGLGMVSNQGLRVMPPILCPIRIAGRSSV
jgi:hypothetical protein